MALTLRDADLARAVAALDDSSSVLFGVRRLVEADPPRRGSPVEIGRGLASVMLPGEDGFRDLKEHELDALLMMAAAGEVRFACPFTPAIGLSRARTLPTFRLESGELARPGDPRYPTRALAGGGVP